MPCDPIRWRVSPFERTTRICETLSSVMRRVYSSSRFVARMARIIVRSGSEAFGAVPRSACKTAVSANGRERARTLAPIRQAGGHWFKPSTAHLSLSRTGFRGERESPDAAGGTILCEAVFVNTVLARLAPPATPREIERHRGGGGSQASSLTARFNRREHPVQNLWRVLAARTASSGTQGRGMPELRRFTAVRHLWPPEARPSRRLLRQE
jgi:hypothetical protein